MGLIIVKSAVRDKAKFLRRLAVSVTVGCEAPDRRLFGWVGWVRRSFVCFQFLKGMSRPVAEILKKGMGCYAKTKGALLCGFVLQQIYSTGDFLQEANQIAWEPGAIDPSLQAWVVAQLKSLLIILAIIALLLSVLKALRLVGFDRLLETLLSPFLRLMGIGREATTLTVIGMTLGLAIGGGLLIREAEQGHVSRRDIFASLTMLALCHSLIEDTLLMVLLGAHVSGILWGRLLFTLLTLALITRWLNRRDDVFVDKWLFNRNLKTPTLPV